jgi:hypothetical protein
MDERARLIQQLDRAREEMQALLTGVDRGQEFYPGWAIKQVLAHILAWEDVTTAALDAHARGEEPAPLEVQDIHAYNAQAVAEREALSYDRVVAEWELAREQLKAAINGLAAERFREPLLYPWGGSGTVTQIVGIMAHHEEEHVQEMQEPQDR